MLTSIPPPGGVLNDTSPHGPTRSDVVRFLSNFIFKRKINSNDRLRTIKRAAPTYPHLPPQLNTGADKNLINQNFGYFSVFSSFSSMFFFSIPAVVIYEYPRCKLIYHSHLSFALLAAIGSRPIPCIKMCSMTTNEATMRISDNRCGP